MPVNQIFDVQPYYKYTKLIFLISLLTILHYSCNKSQSNSYKLHIYNLNNILENAIINDFFSPPVASRIYIYPNIAIYLILNKEQKLIPFNDLPSIPAIPTDVNKEVAANVAFNEIGKQLVYTNDQIITVSDSIMQFYKNDFNESSISYGKKVADIILEWAKQDGYINLRVRNKYVLKNTKGSWTPTPPDYQDALEPNWGKIRPFLLEKVSSFMLNNQTVYSEDTSSLFYKELVDLYNKVQLTDEKQLETAHYWDCNPIVTKHFGHTKVAEKKLTPGGHWFHIAMTASKMQKESPELTSKNLCLVLAAIADAFIVSWEEKYQTNYIRPVTAINRLIDPNWIPKLYTPNFPEYPSGHSTVSAAAASVLTCIYGDNFSFTDTAEVPFGRKSRSFSSFKVAANEAAISRFYGGIHFLPAIEDGQKQGESIGEFIIQKTNICD